MDAILDDRRASRPAGRRGRRAGRRGRYRGRALGAIGDLGCFSFHETKNLICGEGGALAVNDPRFVAAGGDHPREGHQPRAVLPRRGRQVHLGGRRLIATCRASIAGRRSRRPARRGARRSSAGGGDLATATTSGSPALGGRTASAAAAGRADRSASTTITSSTCCCRDRAARTRCLARLRARGIVAVFHYVPLHSSPYGRQLGGQTCALPVTDRVAAASLRAAAPSRASTHGGRGPASSSGERIAALTNGIRPPERQRRPRLLQREEALLPASTRSARRSRTWDGPTRSSSSTT